jgi:superoxide oxidase
MGWKSTEQGYGPPAKALHWAMFLILVCVCALQEFKGIYPRGSDGRAAMYAAHYFLGLVVLALVLPRLVVRFMGVTPQVVPALPLWQERASRAVQWGLYALMVAMPILGWIAASAKSGPIALLGIDLPRLIAPDKAIATQFKDIHEFLVNIIYALFALHVAAAIYHHKVRKDNALRLMMRSEARA